MKWIVKLAMWWRVTTIKRLRWLFYFLTWPKWYEMGGFVLESYRNICDTKRATCGRILGAVWSSNKCFFWGMLMSLSGYLQVTWVENEMMLSNLLRSWTWSVTVIVFPSTLSFYKTLKCFSILLVYVYCWCLHRSDKVTLSFRLRSYYVNCSLNTLRRL